MRLPLTKTLLWRSATLLLISIMILACSLLPWSAKTSPATTPDPPTEKATVASEQSTETTKPTDEPAGQASATAPPTAGPYSLAISDRYPFFEKKVVIAQSLAARAGQLWIGTVAGTIEEVDSQTRALGKSISLASQGGGGMPMVYPIPKIAFEGKYLWAFAGFLDDSTASSGLFAIDPATGEIVHQWGLNSPEWMQGYERGFTTEGFGVSPGKIWIDGHIVNTETFEVQKVSMPGAALFAYDEREWMWMNGELGGACDDLILVNVNDPSKEWCEDDWPFFTHETSGMHPTGMGSPMVFAGDKVWMAGAWPAEKMGDNFSNVLEAYPADIYQGMQAKGPLVSIPFIESPSSIKLFFAGGYLWVLDTLGDNKIGYLFQLDPQTGETLNSLDLVGDKGRALGDVPVDIATEGDNLWVLTSRQLLRIKLP